MILARNPANWQVGKPCRKENWFLARYQPINSISPVLTFLRHLKITCGTHVASPSDVRSHGLLCTVAQGCRIPAMVQTDGEVSLSSTASACSRGQVNFTPIHPSYIASISQVRTTLLTFEELSQAANSNKSVCGWLSKMRLKKQQPTNLILLVWCLCVFCWCGNLLNSSPHMMFSYLLLLRVIPHTYSSNGVIFIYFPKMIV